MNMVLFSIDNYVPKWLSVLLFKLGYSTYPKYSGWSTFRITTDNGIKEIWIGGLNPMEHYLPCPSWRLLFDDLGDRVNEYIKYKLDR